MKQRRGLLILQLAVIAAVCAFFFFFGLGAFGLVGADEPRYAQIAREMYNRHDWIVPTLNGQPWLEKPVFLYWKIWNSYEIFGVQDWAARIPAAAHASVLVLVVFFFMRRFRPGSEMIAAMITASSAAMIAFGRGASTDMPLCALFAMAMLAWWTWHAIGRKLWLAFFYALLGFGALTKGPLAPGLAILIVAAYALLRRDKKIFVRSLWWPGFLLFFLITLPWYIAVQIKVPQFFRTFFIEHNLERFGTNLYQHSQPFWYYIPVFLLSMVPWIVFTIMAVIDGGRTSIRGFRARSAANEDDDGLLFFLLIWIVIPIVFFSISRSKLPGYILPAIPAAAILTAEYLARGPGQLNRWTRVLYSLICGVLSLIALLVPFLVLRMYLPKAVIPAVIAIVVIAAAIVSVVVYRGGLRLLQLVTMKLHSLFCGWLLLGALLAPSLMLKVPLPLKTLSLLIAGAFLIAILVLLVVRFGGVRMLHFATLIPVIVAMTFLLRPAAVVIDEVSSARTVAAQLEHLGVPQGPIAVFNVKRDVEYGLNFYRNQAISRYERNEIPAEAHLLVAHEGNGGALQAILGLRQLSPLGAFPPQHLEFFLVSKK